MKLTIDFLTKYRYTLFLLLLLFAAEAVVNPFGNFPLNDDWSYSKSVYLFHTSGQLEIGDFGAMSLITHLAWGVLFTKLFGFSFILLRLSTLVSSIIGALVFFKLITLINPSKNFAFLLTAALLFNPIYFNLSNTYMTDVNFNTLLILGTYSAFLFFKKLKWGYLVLLFLISCFLVLIRQFGIVLPIAFTVSCFFLKTNKWKFISLSVISSVIVYLILKWYESRIPVWFTTGGTYKYSGNFNLLDTVFWKGLFEHAKVNFRFSMLQILVYASVPSLLILPGIMKGKGKVMIAGVFVTVPLLIYFLFRETVFPFKNIFSNMCLGPETFYESSQTYIPHTYSEEFKSRMDILKIICASSTAITCILALVSIKRARRPDNDPGLIFIVSFLLFYSFILFVPEVYFDRYSLPLFTLALLGFSFGNFRPGVSAGIGILFLVLQSYVAIFGTRDYFELNRKKWQAYEYLKREMNADPGEINAGFEIACWNEGKASWWSDYTNLTSYQYLIQFKKEPGFKALKEYEFQRYFPYKKDKINIFVRDSLQ